MKETVSLYEPASSDGHNSMGEGRYFLEKAIADQASRIKNGSYATPSIEHRAIEAAPGEYFLLTYSDPVCLADSEAEQLKIRESALGKLSEAEKTVLGL